jgi:hypothetical protein
MLLSDLLHVNTHKGEKHLITRDKLHAAMDESLFKQYNLHLDKGLSLSEQCIHQLVLKLGLEMRFDSVEVVRNLMLQKYYPISSHKTAKQVWLNYLNSLDKTFIDSNDLAHTTSNDVYEKMTDIVLEKKLDRQAFMLSLKDWAIKVMDDSLGKNITDLTSGMERITHAMTSLFVAWVGYRKSEFGFPLDAIHVEPNLDILDNSHVPFRFKLKWVVPKTNKTTKIDREITSQCYQVASQLNELFQPVEGAPCLYEGLGKNKLKIASNQSGAAIDTRIKANWESFVNSYLPFEEVTTLELLSKISESELSDDEKKTLNVLSTKYNLSSARVKHLLDARNEVKCDLEKLNCSAFMGDKPQKRFKASLLEFNRTGNISDRKHKQIVQKYLSDETKEWLKSEGINLDQKSMIDISNELLQGVRYPSSHAFRHIWAEAVLTRYQGDIGAVIRHQFCHLDASFFVAYVRDKEPQNLIKAARITVLNSIVDTLLLDSDKIGQNYLGGFSRYVKKISHLTKAITQSELVGLRELIAGRVISIQPSHFVTCIPREGAERRAMCAEFGEINPHNAKPEFCLVCTNGLITEGNLKGIWMTIQPFAKEALNEHVMGFMIEQHLPTLRSGYNKIKELKSTKNEGSVIKILNVLEKAIKSIEDKLKEEGGLYG